MRGCSQGCRLGHLVLWSGLDTCTALVSCKTGFTYSTGTVALQYRDEPFLLRVMGIAKFSWPTAHQKRTFRCDKNEICGAAVAF